MSKKRGRPPAVWRHKNLQVSASIWLGHTWSHRVTQHKSAKLVASINRNNIQLSSQQGLARLGKLSSWVHPSKLVHQLPSNLKPWKHTVSMSAYFDKRLVCQALTCGVGKKKVMHWLEKVHPNHPNPWSNMWTANKWKIWFACFKRE